jgi:ribose transport system permease protein
VLARTCSENGVINQIAGLDINVQSVISGVFLLVVVVAQRLLARTRA